MARSRRQMIQTLTVVNHRQGYLTTMRLYSCSNHRRGLTDDSPM